MIIADVPQRDLDRARCGGRHRPAAWRGVRTARSLPGSIAALVVATALHLLIAGLPEQLPTNPALYIGGAVGAIFIAIQTVTVARIGVLVLGLCLVAGQLAASLLFDAIAPLGPASTTATAIAVVLAFIGVLVASIRWPRRRAGATRPQPE